MPFVAGFSPQRAPQPGWALPGARPAPAAALVHPFGSEFRRIRRGGEESSAAGIDPQRGVVLNASRLNPWSCHCKEVPSWGHGFLAAFAASPPRGALGGEV